MKKTLMQLIGALSFLLLLSIACNMPVWLSSTDLGTDDTTPPVISNLSLSNQTGYYNEQTCGPTNITIEMDVSDDSGLIRAVGVQYRYTNDNANGDWQQADFRVADAGRFTGTIDVASEANAILSGADGMLVYQVYAIDTAGNAQTEPEGNVKALSVKSCVGGVASSGNTSSSAAPPTSGSPPPPPGSGSPSPTSTPTGKSGSTPPSGSSGNNNANDSTPPTISNVQDNGPAYYDGNSCGTTSLTLTAQVSDNAGSIKRVYVRYNYMNSTTGAGGNFIEKDLSSSGSGNYSINLDMNAEAASFLNGADGVFQYQIMASDGSNNWQTYPNTNQPGGGHPAGIEIKRCSSAVGQPPQAPASQPISISSIQTYPNPVHYGVCSGGEQTSMQIQATIDPLDQISSAIVRYGYGQGLMIVASYNYTASMYQLGIGDYAADVNAGNDLFGQMSGDGWVEGIIEVTDLQGQVTSSSIFYVDVKECVTQFYILPSINSFNGPNGSLSPGDSYTLSWDTSDAVCGVFLDGSSVNASGSTTLSAPSDNSYQTWTHTLTARGGNCNNPDEVNEAVQVVVEPSATVSKGSGSVYDEYSLDLGDGNGDDIIFDAQSSDTVLYAVWGSQLAVWYGGQPSVADCTSYINSGAYSTVSITTYDIVCYKTGSGNYGYLTINGMFLDLDTLANSYVDVSYNTEISP